MLALLFLLLFQPVAASHAAAVLVGEPELGPALVRICRRESRCQAIGIHLGDAHRGRAAWRNATLRGRLHPERCRWHRQGDPRSWSTRGPWGTMAAYTVPYLGRCVPAWALDLPIVGAVAAARRLMVSRRRNVPALRRWAALDTAGRT